MSQLFQRRANAIARATIVGGALLLVGIGAALYAIGRSDYWTRTEEPLAQPVPFSHEHHVAGLGIDCRYCHTSVEKSSFAGIPPTETCMTCHSQVWKDAPVLQPVRDSLQNGLPLTWKVQPLYMRWCLDCHRQPEKHLRPRDEVFNLAYTSPENQISLGRERARQNHVNHEGLTDCYTCHR